jgi:hypothetical protein
MIDKLVCSIKSAMMESGYFTEYFPLAERVYNGSKYYYSQPIEGNVYEDIFNMDVNGTGYTRLNGEVSFSSATSAQKLTSCENEPVVTVKVPLRVVVSIPKGSKSEHELAFDLCVILNNIDTIDGLTADVDIFVTKYNTDSLSIWPQEVEGDKYQVNPKFNYIAFDLLATVSSKLSCLTPDCNGYTYA